MFTAAAIKGGNHNNINTVKNKSANVKDSPRATPCEATLCESPAALPVPRLVTSYQSASGLMKQMGPPVECLGPLGGRARAARATRYSNNPASELH